MILSLYAVALWASSLFSNAFSDKAITDTEKIKVEKKAAVYSTGWEAVPAWTTIHEEGQFAAVFNRNTPELNKEFLNGGAIAVFAKGYDFEKFNKDFEKPLKLPFYMMSSSEDFKNPFAWFSENTVGSIKVGLQMDEKMKSAFEKNNSQIRFRYFILSKDFLQQHQLTAQSIKSLSYSQLTQMLAVAP